MLDKIRTFFEEYEEDSENASSTIELDEESTLNLNTQNIKIGPFNEKNQIEIYEYSVGKSDNIMDQLKKGKISIVTYDLEDEQHNRAINQLEGFIFVTNGNIQKLKEDTYIYSPKNIDIVQK